MVEFIIPTTLDFYAEISKVHLAQLMGVLYEEGLACFDRERSASSAVGLCGFGAKLWRGHERQPHG
jgi:hypothetical protein